MTEIEVEDFGFIQVDLSPSGNYIRLAVPDGTVGDLKFHDVWLSLDEADRLVDALHLQRGRVEENWRRRLDGV